MAYREEVYGDVKDWILDNVEITMEDGELHTEYGDKWDTQTSLEDELWAKDSVTGNGSGSYTFSTWKAEQNIRDEFDMFLDMVKDFDYSAEQVGNWFLNKDWETMDVLVRCWLLSSVIEEVLDDIEEEQAA